MRRRTVALAPQKGRPGGLILLAFFVSALLLTACGRGPNATAPVPPPVAPPLIARADLFGDPARDEAKLSARGEMIAFIAPRNGVPNLWVVPVSTLGAGRALTNETERGIRRYQWAADDAHLLYLREIEGGDRLFSVDVTTGAIRPLTTTAHTEIVGQSSDDATGIIVTINDRDAAAPDLYRIDILTGARTLIERNTRRIYRYILDRANKPRLALRATPDGGAELLTRPEDGAWRVLFAIPFEDTLSSTPLALDGSGRSFLMLDSTGRDRAGLVRVDLETGAKTVLGESPRADIVDVWIDPATREPEAYAAEYLRREWRSLTPEAQADLDYLDAQLEGEPSVASRSLDDKRWIVQEYGPTTPTRSYLYDRSDPANRKLTLLFRHRPGLERAALQPMIPVEIESRDGLTLVSYLTLPIGSDANGDSRPDAPIPLVILPHDGPWTRDSYGFDAAHQWLANRGYAALSVNYRGSTGFGKAFLNQGNRELGGKMQEDLLDAVQWAVEEGVAQPERIAIFGASYGGFAALHGLAFTPQRFACGVDLSGPANLESWLASAPARSEWMRPMLYQRIGDPRTPEGRQMLRDRSPLFRASAIQRPLLIGQGARDPRVARAEPDQMSQAPRAQRAGLVYLLYPEEARLFARTANRLSFYAAADQFLAGCLGGRSEPAGGVYEAARLQAPAGAARIDGLARYAPPAPPPAAVQAVPDAAPTEDAPTEDAPQTP